jgi:hypothetical protein
MDNTPKGKVCVIKITTLLIRARAFANAELSEELAIHRA